MQRPLIENRSARRMILTKKLAFARGTMFSPLFRKLSRLLASALVEFSCLSAHALIAGECAAHAQTTSVDIDNGDTLVSFTITPRACDSGCRGSVDSWINYKDKAGHDHFYSQSASWLSKRGEDVDVTKKGYESHCHDSNLGAWRVRNVEVRQLSCY